LIISTVNLFCVGIRRLLGYFLYGVMLHSFLKRIEIEAISKKGFWFPAKSAGSATSQGKFGFQSEI
jgi:hypothetical protein